MQPVDIGAVSSAGKGAGCRTPVLGAAGLLMAAIFGTIGTFSLGSDPVVAVVTLFLAGVGGFLFGRAWVADRRRLAVERSTIRRRPAAASDARGLRYVDGATPSGNAIENALRSFLDDPDRLESLEIEGPRSFRLRVALLPTDRNVLRAEAIAFTRLATDEQPGPDAGHGMAALGWAAPTPLSGHDFVTEWSLPIDVTVLGAFILSTARIYNVDTTLLRPLFGNLRTVGDTNHLLRREHPPNSARSVLP